jgi:PLAT/LH2 domain
MIVVTSTLQSKYAPTRFLNTQNMRPRLTAALCALLAGLAISAAGAAQASAAPYKWYNVCVKTADEPWAGTDSDVQLEVRGTNGYTGFVTLDHVGYDDFETGSLDCFGYYAHDVQTIQSVRVWTNGDQNWKLAYVRVNGVPFGFNIWMPAGITAR